MSGISMLTRILSGSSSISYAEYTSKATNILRATVNKNKNNIVNSHNNITITAIDSKSSSASNQVFPISRIKPRINNNNISSIPVTPLSLSTINSMNRVNKFQYEYATLRKPINRSNHTQNKGLYCSSCGYNCDQ